MIRGCALPPKRPRSTYHRRHRALLQALRIGGEQIINEPKCWAKSFVSPTFADAEREKRASVVRCCVLSHPTG
jgi:hypothetical protein